ncbi:heat shock protein 9/12-domain-containing protein [Dipodascopsis tothii]|uniref:heat shock protein 9/12-domain-containing protein n=1 Tax=Dipodascopsis tothii TaxID=44089 RepID=UPI0034CD99D5
MSDVGRKSMGDKFSESVKPDSQKSYGEQVKESVTDAYDNAARKMQPTEAKSTTQKMGDQFTESRDSANAEGKTFMDSAKDYASQAQKKGEELLNQAQDYMHKKN